eukprot:PhM_4_TR371/c0_g1_i1/m.67941
MSAKLVHEHSLCNRGPIFEVFRRLVPTLPFEKKRLLEAACGSGQHMDYMLPQIPDLTWTATDLDALESVKAYAADLAEDVKPRFEGALTLDLSAHDTIATTVERGAYHIVYAANLFHISPIECTEGFVRLAGHALAPGGVMCYYGCLMVDGKPTTESNARFDKYMKSKDPRFGIRDVSFVKSEAAKVGLEMVEKLEMPENNFFLIFKKL